MVEAYNGSGCCIVHPLAIADLPLEKELEVCLGSYFVDVSALKEGEAVVRYAHPRHGPGWLVFRDPVSVIVARSVDEVAPLVSSAARFAEDGGVAVGFLTYEAGMALNSALSGFQAPGVLAAFALFGSNPSFSRELTPCYEHVVADVTGELDFQEYRAKFERVKLALAAGESYQVNLTFKLPFTLNGSAASFFANRCGVDPPPFSSFMRFGESCVASFSPELLYERVGSRVTMRPMKGTRLASGSSAELSTDEKSIAENIMIVDMVRNDLGSLAAVGSVSAMKLLQVERHRGLLQMVSEVTADVDAPADELLKAVFPAASITGAPKVETTRLIREIEDGPRGVYCGAIGFMHSGGDRFSVAIRTASIDYSTGKGEFGVGSGVVWDSVVEDEYRECLSKSEVLVQPGKQWELITALHRDHLKDRAILERHVRRLSSSASEVGLNLCPEKVWAALRELDTFGEKVRIAVRADGSVNVSSGSSAMRGEVVRATLASVAVDSADPNLRLKSTSRQQYEEALEANVDFDEVMLWDKEHLLTEFCRGSVIIALDDRLVSPWLPKGHLRSIAMERLVDLGKVEPGSPSVDDLFRAKAVFFANAVVGVLPVELHLGQEVIKSDWETVSLLNVALSSGHR